MRFHVSVVVVVDDDDDDDDDDDQHTTSNMFLPMTDHDDIDPVCCGFGLGFVQCPGNHLIRASPVSPPFGLWRIYLKELTWGKSFSTSPGSPVLWRLPLAMQDAKRESVHRCHAGSDRCGKLGPRDIRSLIWVVVSNIWIIFLPQNWGNYPMLTCGYFSNGLGKNHHQLVMNP